MGTEEPVETGHTNKKDKYEEEYKKNINTNTKRIGDLRTRRRWLRLVRQRNQGGGRKKPEHLKIVTINSHSHFGQASLCVIPNGGPLYLLLHHEELCDDEEEPGYVAHHEDHHDAGKNPPIHL